MKILAAQCNFTIGDIEGNTNGILAIMARHGQEKDLIIFSEMAITGYYPYDLIDNRRFIDKQDAALKRIQEATKGLNAAVVVGCITRNDFPATGKPYHNSVIVFEDGFPVMKSHKMLLPDYNIFGENRFFSPGSRPGLWRFRGKSIGFLICEDGWDGDAVCYERDPVSWLERENLDLIVSINASPSNTGKQKLRHQRFGRIAKRCDAPLVYLNQVGGHDEIVFDGASCLFDRKGVLLGQSQSFKESHPNFELVGKEVENVYAFSAKEPLSEIALMYQQICRGLRDYVFRCGFQRVIVGSSGGIDSAVTLALAAEALGPERVLAVTMPSKYSSAGSVDDSVELCRNLGVQLFTDPIKDEFEVAIADFERAYGRQPSGLAQENRQARIRGAKLMELSNDTEALLLTTGNKSEMACGYGTIYGDMSGGLNLIGDAYKTEVYDLARYHNAIRPKAAIPEEIITKPPSAELAPDQKDTDSLPDYEILDAILKLYIEQDLLPEAERQELLARLRVADDALIEKVIKLVNRAEYKRRQAPPIIRLQRRSFGRGRQLPIAAVYPNVDGLSDLALIAGGCDA